MPIDPAKPFDLTFKVDPNWVDLRLDQFVKAMVPSMSRTKIQKYVKAGRVEVNGQARPANWRVRLGDTVLLRCNVPEEGADAGKRIPLDIIYEDNDILALNKQPGLVVHPVSLHRHDTLLNALYWRYKDILPEEQEISLANRLDEHTSGMILVAKHTLAKQRLQEQFENRRTSKAYLALCAGIVQEDSGTIDLPIGPEPGRTDRCKMGIRHDKEGKPSLTRFIVQERFARPRIASLPGDAHAAEPPADPHPYAAGLTLVRLEPHTGRQHQLRVHMAAIGHPLVCDDRYGNGRPLYIRTRKGASVGIARYALHAAELTFTHPATNKPMTIQAPLAADLRTVLDAARDD